MKHIFSNSLFSFVIAIFVILLLGVSEITPTMAVGIAIGATLSSAVLQICTKVFNFYQNKIPSLMMTGWSMSVTIGCVIFLTLIGPLSYANFSTVTMIATGAFFVAFLPLILSDTV
jgi:hypothetical protein